MVHARRDPLPACDGRVKQLVGEIDRHTVMCLQDEKAQDMVGITFCQVSYGEKIAARLGHFFVINIDKTVVHPVADKRFACCRFTLRDFIFMVREGEIHAARVNVNRLA